MLVDVDVGGHWCWLMLASLSWILFVCLEGCAVGPTADGVLPSRSRTWDFSGPTWASWDIHYGYAVSTPIMPWVEITNERLIPWYHWLMGHMDLPLPEWWWRMVNGRSIWLTLLESQVCGWTNIRTAVRGDPNWSTATLWIESWRIDSKFQVGL